MAKGFGEPSLDNKKTRESSSIKGNIDCEQVQNGGLALANQVRQSPPQEWTKHFEDLIDPRGKQGVLHPFITIVMIAFLATIGGATGWEDIETYGISHEVWLSSFLALPFGVPRADTYRRLFERISPASFERSFKSWLNSLVSDLGAQIIPIDGKTVRGSYDRNGEQSALHLVSAKSE